MLHYVDFFFCCCWNNVFWFHVVWPELVKVPFYTADIFSSQIRVWLSHLHCLGWLPVGRLGRSNVSCFLFQEKTLVEVPGHRQLPLRCTNLHQRICIRTPPGTGLLLHLCRQALDNLLIVTLTSFWIDFYKWHMAPCLQSSQCIFLKMSSELM